MSAAPDVYVGPAFVGWRSWRILPFERLGDPTSVRLCASGTQGIPKVWEPGRPTVAVCGKFRTTHEAPWPGCECGVYAYATREAAEAHLESFRGCNADVLGWAFGRVSLWGRIVECEHGWRAEYAYPYAIDVHAEPHVAAAVRRLYGVDVEQRPPFEPLSPVGEDDEVSDVLSELDSLEEQLAKLKASAATIRQRAVVVQSKPRPDPPPEALVPFPALDLSDDDVLVAVFAAIQGELATTTWHAKWYGPAVERSDVIHAARALYGDGSPRKVEFDGFTFWRPDHPANVRRIGAALKSLDGAGLLMSGRFAGRDNLHWRVTRAGLRCIRALQAQERVPNTIIWSSCGQVESEVLLPTKGGFRARVILFDWEIKRDTPAWQAARRGAAAEGRAHYRTWIADWHRRKDGTRLAFSDEEVLAALKRATRRGPAAFPAIMEQLAPGLGTKRRDETGALSSHLVRLSSTGSIRHSTRDTKGRWLWELAPREEEA